MTQERQTHIYKPIVHTFKRNGSSGCWGCGSTEMMSSSMPSKDRNLNNPHGIKPDAGRFFRCRKCGRINDITRISKQSGSGLRYLEDVENYPSPSAVFSGTEALSPDGQTPYQLLAVMGGYNFSHVTLKNIGNQ